jgi:hypothetical protein
MDFITRAPLNDITLEDRGNLHRCDRSWVCHGAMPRLSAGTKNPLTRVTRMLDTLYASCDRERV